MTKYQRSLLKKLQTGIDLQYGGLSPTEMEAVHSLQQKGLCVVVGTLEDGFARITPEGENVLQQDKTETIRFVITTIIGVITLVVSAVSLALQLLG